MNHSKNNNQKRSKMHFDVIVVGSGPAGVHATYPLIEAGLKVAIIDGGLDSKKQDKKIDSFSDANLMKSSHAYDLVRESSHAFNKTYQLLRIKSNIEIIQTLARGGLSEYWHGICDFLTEKELLKIGLPVGDIKREYKEIAGRIKLNAQADLDFHSKLLLAELRSKNNFSSKVYQAPLVFPYRTSSHIEDLKRFKNFTYVPNQLVITVKEEERHVKIKTASIDKSKEIVVSADFLILAAGSINTTRILLRSFNLFDYKTTFLTKAHYLIACLHLRTLIKRKRIEESDLGQLVISSKEITQGLTNFFIQLYRFNPLVIHKVLHYIPLPRILASFFLSIISPSFMIADIRFPAFESKNKFCQLKKEKNGKDVLEISFQESNKEMVSHKNEVNKIVQQLRVLGLLSLKKVNDYTTAHYAGGVPFQQKKGKLSVDMKGKLHQAARIYVADSSTWRALPARPIALTIMANAARVGKNVLKNFNFLQRK